MFLDEFNCYFDLCRQVIIIFWPNIYGKTRFLEREVATFSLHDITNMANSVRLQTGLCQFNFWLKFFPINMKYDRGHIVLFQSVFNAWRKIKLANTSFQTHAQK